MKTNLRIINKTSFTILLSLLVLGTSAMAYENKVVCSEERKESREGAGHRYFKYSQIMRTVIDGDGKVEQRTVIADGLKTEVQFLNTLVSFERQGACPKTGAEHQLAEAQRAEVELNNKRLQIKSCFVGNPITGGIAVFAMNAANEVKELSQFSSNDLASQALLNLRRDGVCPE